MFIITQMPFNERFENVVQLVVTFNQGAFFCVLAMGDRVAEPGKIMNDLNLAAMAVVLLASLKTQIFGIRKFVMQGRRLVKMMYKTLKQMAEVPNFSLSVICT